MRFEQRAGGRFPVRCVLASGVLWASAVFCSRLQEYGSINQNPVHILS
jgi:hypothetical protein